MMQRTILKSELLRIISALNDNPHGDNLVEETKKDLDAWLHSLQLCQEDASLRDRFRKKLILLDNKGLFETEALKQIVKTVISNTSQKNALETDDLKELESIRQEIFFYQPDKSNDSTNGIPIKMVAGTPFTTISLKHFFDKSGDAGRKYLQRAGNAKSQGELQEAYRLYQKALKVYFNIPSQYKTNQDFISENTCYRAIIEILIYNTFYAYSRGNLMDAYSFLNKLENYLKNGRHDKVDYFGYELLKNILDLTSNLSSFYDEFLIAIYRTIGSMTLKLANIQHEKAFNVHSDYQLTELLKTLLLYETIIVKSLSQIPHHRWIERDYIHHVHVLNKIANVLFVMAKRHIKDKSDKSYEDAIICLERVMFCLNEVLATPSEAKFIRFTKDFVLETLLPKTQRFLIETYITSADLAFASNNIADGLVSLQKARNTIDLITVKSNVDKHYLDIIISYENKYQQECEVDTDDKIKNTDERPTPY